MLRIIFMLLFSCTYLCAQDFKADMELLQQKYAKATSISAKVSIDIYENGERSTLSQKGVLKTMGENYFFDYGDHKTLFNKKWILMVNASEKMIVCERWTKEKAEMLKQKHQTFDGAKLAKTYPKIEYKGIKNGLKHYVLSNEQLQFSSIDVFVEQSTGYIIEMKAYYNKNLYENEVYVLTKISDLNLDASLQEQDFDESKFIQTDGKTARGSTGYSSFQVYMTQ